MFHYFRRFHPNWVDRPVLSLFFDTFNQKRCRIQKNQMKWPINAHFEQKLPAHDPIHHYAALIPRSEHATPEHDPESARQHAKATLHAMRSMHLATPSKAAGYQSQAPGNTDTAVFAFIYVIW